jgi:hypothetical protein
MKGFCKFFLLALKSKISLVILVVFCVASFYFGQVRSDMGVFAASGGVLTVCGLLSLIRFTTIEKYLNQDNIVAQSTGLTGPPLSKERAKKLSEQNIAAARIRIEAELRSELAGIALTVVGTLIWAYGSYVPVHW